MARGKRAAVTGREVVVREEPTVMTPGLKGNQPSKPSYASRPRVTVREDRPTVRSGILRRSVESPITLPERRGISGITGRILETSPYGEQILTNEARVLQLNYAALPDIYCRLISGSPLPYNPVEQFVQQIFPLLSQRVIEKGRFVTGSLSGIDVFRNLMNLYVDCFLGFRSLEAIFAAGGMNQGYDLMASGGSQQKIRLEQDLQRLASFPAPQGLVDALDRICGVFSPDETGMSILTVFDTSVSGGQDLSTNAGWAAVLSQLETNGLFTQAPSADVSLFYNVMGTLFGVPKIGPKAVDTSWCHFDAQLTQMAVWHDTTAAKFFATPSAVNGGGGNNTPVPILARRGQPFEPWRLSLLQPAVYSAAGAEGLFTPELPVGLMSMSGGVGDQFLTVWSAGGVRTVVDPTGAGLISAANIATYMGLLTWMASSGTEQGTPQLGPQTADWDVFSASQDILFDETILQYTSIFELAN